MMFLHVAHKLFGQKNRSSSDARTSLLLVALSQGPSTSPRRGDFGVHNKSRKLYKLNMSHNRRLSWRSTGPFVYFSGLVSSYGTRREKKEKPRRPLCKGMQKNISVFDHSPPYDKSGSKTRDSVDKSVFSMLRIVRFYSSPGPSLKKEGWRTGSKLLCFNASDFPVILIRGVAL
jgi:hypothetical protein